MPKDSNTPSGITIGQLGRPHGLLGWINCQIFCENPNLLFQAHLWLPNTPKQSSLTLKAADQKDRPTRLKFAELTDRTLASQWTGAWLQVPEACLPSLKEGEYYRSELVGFAVLTSSGCALGHLTEWLETGAHDVFIVWDQVQQRKHFIPFVEPDIILKICRKTRSMVVRWEPQW